MHSAAVLATVALAPLSSWGQGKTTGLGLYGCDYGFNGHKCVHVGTNDEKCWTSFECSHGDPLPDWNTWPAPSSAFLPREIYFVASNLIGELLLQPSTVEKLSIAYNRITGTLHAHAFTQANLQLFDASRNLLFGTIPRIQAPNLLYLALHQNNLVGTIPPLHQVPQLVTLRLEHNHLTGTIPPMAVVPHLQYLDLSDNQLHGRLPQGLHKLFLTFLGLHTNKLVGTFPDMSSSSLLRIVRIHGNQFKNSGWGRGSGCGYSVLKDRSIQARHLQMVYLDDINDCQQLCLEQQQCGGWTWSDQWWWCKLYAGTYTRFLLPEPEHTTGMAAPQHQCAFQDGLNCSGDDIRTFNNVAEDQTCCQLCHDTTWCLWWTYQNSTQACSVKYNCDNPDTHAGVDFISGTKVSSWQD